MSHHLDSPLARADVRLDITDLYVFAGQSGTVFVMNVCSSITGDIPTPGFHPEARYEFKIDIDDDAAEDLTLRFRFDDRDSAGLQRYTLTRLTGVDAADPTAPGTTVATGVTETALTTDAGVRVWIGMAGDPFWMEPDVMHAVQQALQDGAVVDLTNWDPATASNPFAGQTVYSIVLEVPAAELPTRADHHHRIGVWALSTLATDAGGWRSINRAGLPMIHPLFAPFNEDLSDRLNGGSPATDADTFADSVITAVAAAVAATGTASDPTAYAHSVADRLFPNVLPYVVGTPAVFGFASWNGRSLIDSAPDVMFTLATNTPLSLGIGKESVSPRPSTVVSLRPTAATAGNGNHQFLISASHISRARCHAVPASMRTAAADRACSSAEVSLSEVANARAPSNSTAS